jgi:hypothetical protein
MEKREGRTMQAGSSTNGGSRDVNRIGTIPARTHYIETLTLDLDGIAHSLQHGRIAHANEVHKSYETSR